MVGERDEGKLFLFQDSVQKFCVVENLPWLPDAVKFPFSGSLLNLLLFHPKPHCAVTSYVTLFLLDLSSLTRHNSFQYSSAVQHTANLKQARQRACWMNEMIFELVIERKGRI